MSVIGFATVAEMEEYYKINSATVPYGITFKNLGNNPASLTALPRDVQVDIRPRTEEGDRWRTRNTFPFFQDGTPRSMGEPGKAHSI